MSATIDTWTGRFGLLAGILVVAAWLAVAGRPGDAAEPAASIRLGALVNGELEISPLTKPVLESSKLRAGGRAATGTLRLRNVTPVRRDFALRTSASQRELDRSAQIEVADGDTTLLRTTLGRSRAWTGTGLRLAKGETRKLTVRVWIPKNAPDGWQAGRGDVTLEFRSAPEQTR